MRRQRRDHPVHGGLAEPGQPDDVDEAQPGVAGSGQGIEDHRGTAEGLLQPAFARRDAWRRPCLARHVPTRSPARPATAAPLPRNRSDRRKWRCRVEETRARRRPVRAACGSEQPGLAPLQGRGRLPPGQGGRWRRRAARHMRGRAGIAVIGDQPQLLRHATGRGRQFQRHRPEALDPVLAAQRQEDHALDPAALPGLDREAEDQALGGRLAQGEAELLGPPSPGASACVRSGRRRRRGRSAPARPGRSSR